MQRNFDRQDQLTYLMDSWSNVLVDPTTLQANLTALTCNKAVRNGFTLLSLQSILCEYASSARLFIISTDRDSTATYLLSLHSPGCAQSFAPSCARHQVNWRSAHWSMKGSDGRRRVTSSGQYPRSDRRRYAYRRSVVRKSGTCGYLMTSP